MDDQPNVEGQPSSEEEPQMIEGTSPPEAPEAPQLPPPASAPQAPPPVSPSSARTWSMLAHLSILLNLFTGFLGPIVALIIYLVFKDRSRYVAYQAMQSFVFQLVFFIGAGALAAIAWIISALLVVVIVGCCLMPFALLLSVVPIFALVYGVVAAVQAAQGDDFRYWLVGDWVLPSEGSPGPMYDS